MSYVEHPPLPIRTRSHVIETELNPCEDVGGGIDDVQLLERIAGWGADMTELGNRGESV